MAQIINKTGVRNMVDDMNIGADFYDALDQRAIMLVQTAIDRAQANGRKTVKARDC